MYSIEFSPTSENQLKKLEKNVQKRILNILERIKIRPFHFIRRIINSSYYRLRVGDYRVILEIIKERLIIFVVEVGHRRSIYK